MSPARPAPASSALLLGLVVLAGALLPWLADPAPPRASDLLLPGLQQALQPAPQPDQRPFYLGLAPLLLGGSCLLAARGRAAWLLRGGLATALVLAAGVAGPSATITGGVLLAACLATCAGWALRQPEEPAWPRLAAAAGAVLALLVLVAWAARAGSLSDRALVQQVARLWGSTPAGPAAAAGLRWTLDRAAAAAIVTLGAVLFWGRRRGAAAAWLLAVVSAADLLLARTPPA